MTSTRMWHLVIALLLCGTAARADLNQVKAERNLEKRSKLALDNAMNALKEAREAYGKGDNAAVQARIDEVRDSVEVARTSLQETGKDPRRSPKWFKRAEIDTRELLRRLDAFQHEMSYADRPVLDKTKAFVQQVHDELLEGLMEGRRK